MSTAVPIGHARVPIWQKDRKLQDAAAFNMAKCCAAWIPNIKEREAFNLSIETENTLVPSSLVVKILF